MDVSNDIMDYVRNDTADFILALFSISNTLFSKANHLEKQWSGLVQSPPHISVWETGISVDVLRYVGAKSVRLPEGFVSFHNLNIYFQIFRPLRRISKIRRSEWQPPPKSVKLFYPSSLPTYHLPPIHSRLNSDWYGAAHSYATCKQGETLHTRCSCVTAKLGAVFLVSSGQLGLFQNAHQPQIPSLSFYSCQHVCMCECVYVCVCVYVCIYMHVRVAHASTHNKIVFGQSTGKILFFNCWNVALYCRFLTRKLLFDIKYVQSVDVMTF